MSGLRDARVLQAFTQGVQRAYMLGVEQRLSWVSGDINSALETFSPTLRAALQASSGGITTTSTTYVDTTFSVNLTVEEGRSVLVIFCSDDFWIASASSENAALALRVDGGTEEVICTTYKIGSNTNTYGVCGSAVYLNVPAGRHNYNLRIKTSGGTAYLGTSSGNRTMLAAIQL